MALRFEQLIELHHDELFAYLWRLLGKRRNSDAALDVEDLVQDVFMRAYESYGRLRPDSNPRAWLYKIATNCAFTRLRRAKNWRLKVSELERTAVESRVAGDREYLAARIRILVTSLPGKQRTCITLRYLQDLEYSEIAEILNCSEASARANVHQGVQRLRRALKEQL